MIPLHYLEYFGFFVGFLVGCGFVFALFVHFFTFSPESVYFSAFLKYFLRNVWQNFKALSSIWKLWHRQFVYRQINEKIKSIVQALVFKYGLYIDSWSINIKKKKRQIQIQLVHTIVFYIVLLFMYRQHTTKHIYFLGRLTEQVLLAEILFSVSVLRVTNHF